MKLIIKTALANCAASIAIALASPAIAQETAEADGSVLSGDIVVTAQKRQENVQDVGIAISAFGGDQLRALGIAKSSDIASYSPGVYISGSLAGQNTQFTIRGVTQNDFNDIVEAPNAVYLDEGYIAIAQAQSFAVFDIERVEVLKGPQGTLFGRNATGGLVHYISKLPSLTAWEGYVDLKFGVTDSVAEAGIFTAEAGIGGPISDKIGVRAAGRWNKQEPYLKNLYPLGAVGGSPGLGAGADLGNDDTLAGRFTVLAEPSDGVQLIFSANGSRARVNTGPYQQKPTIAQYDAQGELINVLDVGPNETRASIGVNGRPGVINGDAGSDLNNDGIVGGPGELYGRPAGADFFGFRDPDGPGPLFSSDFAFEDHGYVDTWGLNFRAKFDLSDNITLSSVTDYKDYKKLLFIDVDAGPTNQLANYGNLDAQSFTQELRLNGSADQINWTAGLYFLHIDNLSRNGLKAPINGTVPGNPLDIASTARLKTESYSVFGQFEYDLTEQFRVVAGARLINEKKRYNFIQQLFVSPNSRVIQPAQTVPGFPLTIGPAYPGGVPSAYSDKRSKTLWAGKLQLEYRPNSDTLIYAGINRGTKAGSYNAQLNGGLPTPVSAIRYGSETLWSYEGGFKLTLLDNLLRLNGAVFYYDYKDHQAFLFTGVAGLVVNADARTIGGELTIQATPAKGLDIAVGISQFDAIVKDVPLRVGGPIRKDLKPTYAPETQASAIVRYAWDLFGGEMAANANLIYSSSYFYNLRNFDADKFGAYANLDLGLNWTSANGAFQLGVSIDNVTDKRIGLQGYDLATLCGCNEVSYKLPRTFSVNYRHSF
ncbi:MAG: TonB-dependent receptor [Alphaproteobacteria bacterium]|nr:TonB-dependent receptor [Alphaproteobacteria bacterium]